MKIRNGIAFGDLLILRSAFRLRKEFIAPKWRQIFADQGLGFDYLWDLPLEPVGEPNTGRGRDGWSTASIWSLKMVDGKERRLILKRQQNHTSRTICHPVRGIPTFWKELSNILRFKQLGMAVVDPVYFCWRRNASGIQAILVTEYLEGHTPLDELVGKWLKGWWPDRVERNRLIKAVAAVVSKMHSEGMQHILKGCSTTVSTPITCLFGRWIVRFRYA
jgi:hypothetical protein